MEAGGWELSKSIITNDRGQNARFARFLIIMVYSFAEALRSAKRVTIAE